jgi:lysophospholipase L1-like esterase
MTFVAGSTFIYPTNPNITYMGRIDFSTPVAPLFDWPGVQIQFYFTGPSIILYLADPVNWYDVFIDGVEQATLITNSTSEYTYYTSNASANHSFVLYKRTEGYYGIAMFLGFLISGESLAPPPRLTRRIEFVGDSLTCGYGVLSPSTVCNATQLLEYEENYLAYDAITGRALDAEYHVIAYSGKGMVRNAEDPNQISLYPMPKYYMQTLVNNETQNWNFSAWVPDVVTIALGSNDFDSLPQPTQAQFEGTFTFMEPGFPNTTTPGFGYLNFIVLVHSLYPNAQIVCLCGNTTSTPMTTYIQDIVAQAQAHGANFVHFFEVSSAVPFTGCDGHPSVAAQNMWAKNLTQAIASTMNWTISDSANIYY